MENFRIKQWCLLSGQTLQHTRFMFSKYKHTFEEMVFWKKKMFVLLFFSGLWEQFMFVCYQDASYFASLRIMTTLSGCVFNIQIMNIIHYIIWVRRKNCYLRQHTRQRRTTVISSSEKERKSRRGTAGNFNNVSVIPLIVIFPLHE